MQYAPPIQRTATVDVGETVPSFGEEQPLIVDKTLSVAWFARRLADVVPNPWQAARIAQEMIERLRENVSDDEIFDRRTDYSTQLRRHVTEEAERQAEAVFREKLSDGQISFSLHTGSPMYRVPDHQPALMPEFPRPLTGSDGQQLNMSLFEVVLDEQFDSDLERRFARYLNEEKALKWWHRVAARQRGDYYLRGWRQNRIWPDFVAIGGISPDHPYILILETKGQYFQDSDDTEYKRKVFEALEETFRNPRPARRISCPGRPGTGNLPTHL